MQPFRSEERFQEHPNWRPKPTPKLSKKKAETLNSTIKVLGKTSEPVLNPGLLVIKGMGSSIWMIFERKPNIS